MRFQRRTMRRSVPGFSCNTKQPFRSLKSARVSSHSHGKSYILIPARVSRDSLSSKIIEIIEDKIYRFIKLTSLWKNTVSIAAWQWRESGKTDRLRTGTIKETKTCSSPMLLLALSRFKVSIIVTKMTVTQLRSDPLGKLLERQSLSRTPRARGQPWQNDRRSRRD